jgi:TolB-like protein/DNA-binding winged helix-turn-helix (wHTH) protein/tetratricopeptide (TPR) repeat protein
MLLTFGDFELDQERRQLLRSGGVVPLEPKAYELLCLLIDRRPKALSRAQIRDAIWPGTFISESTLGVVVNNVRQALDDDARQPRFIRTVHGFGYAFCGEVAGGNREARTESSGPPSPQRASAGASSPGRRLLVTPRWILAAAVSVAAAAIGLGLWTFRRAPAATPVIRSLAVLPFENLSRDPAQDYFADGMHDALTTALSQVGALRVISRTSSSRYKRSDRPLPEIARELQVDAVIEGTVLQQGDRVRITTQLVHGASDTSLWAERYDRPMGDVLAVHDEVARAVARRIAVSLTPEEERRLARARAVDPEVYREFLKGEFLVDQYSPEAHRRTGAHYRAAIRLDANFAPAHAGLSFALVNDWWEWMDPKVIPEARAAALRALELDGSLPEAHIAVANVRMVLDWDWAGAEAAFQTGYRLNPRSTTARWLYATYLLAMGRSEAAVSLAEEALTLDPRSPAAHDLLALILECVGRQPESLEYWRKSLDLDPSSVAPHMHLGLIHARGARFHDALPNLRRAEAILASGTRNLGVVAYGYARASQRSEALRILDRLKVAARTEKVAPAEFAWAYSGLGDKEQSLAWLEKAYEEREPFLIWLRVDWLLESLRGEPRFQAVVRRMAFPGERR